jgi:hypothetical protein
MQNTRRKPRGAEGISLGSLEKDWGENIMTQVILNGKALGNITADNLDTFIRNTQLTIVSRTATTINFEG